MGDNLRFLHGAQNVAGHHVVAHLGLGDEFPFQLPLQGGHFHAPFQVVTGDFHYVVQGPLDAVVNAADQPRA